MSVGARAWFWTCPALRLRASYNQFVSQFLFINQSVRLRCSVLLIVGSTPPTPDDMLVFSGPEINSPGHVAIVTDVILPTSPSSIGTVSIIEQNWSCTGTARLDLNYKNGAYTVTRWKLDGSPSALKVVGRLRFAPT